MKPYAETYETHSSRTPVLETERLLLRAPRANDLAASMEIWSAPEVYRFITKKPTNEMESWGRLLRYAGHWAWLGYGFFGVVEKSTGAYIGEIGPGDFRREMDAPKMKGVPEIGWVLNPRAHGKGYATEALRVVMYWLDTELKVPRTTCMIDIENDASTKVARKLGFQPMGQGVFMGDLVNLYERIKP